MSKRPEIDLEPTEYRRWDERAGRWLQNVDRKACAWGTLIPLAGIGMFVWAFIREGQSDVATVLMLGAAFGASFGALLVMALRRLD